MPFTKGNKLGKGGNRPNSGRKKLPVRQLCAVEFEKRIPLLAQIADSEKERTNDRIAALRELARIGVGDKIEHSGSVQFNPITLEGDKTAADDND